MTAPQLPALVETPPPNTPAVKSFGMPSVEQAEWFQRNATALERNADNLRSMAALLAEPPPPVRVSKGQTADLVLQFLLALADSSLTEEAALARAKRLVQLYRASYPLTGLSAPT